MRPDEIFKLCTDGIWYTCMVTPLGKPRMTRRDRWKNRECVSRYHSFKDEFRSLLNGKIPFPHQIKSVSWIAYLPIPESWSKKKKAEMAGTIHQQKPDRDNIDKAILDSLFGDDSHVAVGLIGKFWDDGKGPRIEILFGV